MPSSRLLNVFFAVDNNYLVHFAVALTSIIENNKDLTITFYVIHDLDDTTRFEEAITFFRKNHKATIVVIKADSSIFENFNITRYISKAAYFRLLFADLLPATATTGLYIDCDTVVTGSLKGLTELSFFTSNTSVEFSLLAVSDKHEDLEIKRLENIGVNTSKYFNSGVMFLNLEKWRRDAVSKALIQIAIDYKDNLDWWDQDALNIFFRNQCGPLDSSFNMMTKDKLAVTPIVIHYSGSSKPWHYLNEHPYKSLYWKYLKLSPFKNEQFEVITAKHVIGKYLGRVKRLLQIAD